MTLGERVAARTIAESFRSLADPLDIGRSLLAIYAGVDPFAKPDAANPDKLPVPGPVPIDMTHRMAALKMYLEYGYGKPLQGVVVDAQVRQETTVREERTHVVELRTIAARDPAAREALRTIARAMLQVDAGNAQPVRGLAQRFTGPASEPVPHRAQPAIELPAGETGNEPDLGARPESAHELEDDLVDAVEDGARDGDGGGVESGEVEDDLHARIVDELGDAVNRRKSERFPGGVL